MRITNCKKDTQCKQGPFSMWTLTVDLLEKEEIADRLSLMSTMSVYMSTASLKLTQALIYSAPDLLLFCHPDMFNKYCRAGAGYTKGVVVCLH